MCIAIPSRVISIDGNTALVERFGEQLTVSLMLLEERPAVGDYLIVQAQSFALERIDRDSAEEALRLIEEAFGRVRETDSGETGGEIWTA
jgi:hydrogenase expression/formation protein HypC